MLRNVDMNEISDGRRYKAGDMVRIGCDGCKGGADCCHNMVNTIRLDPYDIYCLCNGLGMTFEELMVDTIELQVIDGLIEPVMKMAGEKNACPFLNEEGRCNIHAFRPGFCRMFPLGRIYEDGDFSYYMQTKECPYPNRSKIKIGKWLGIPNLPEYEAYIRSWHANVVACREKLQADAGQSELARELNMARLKKFYVKPYDAERSFYEQIAKRLQEETPA